MTALRRRMLEDMQVRHLSAGTQQVYRQHIARFARSCGRSPAVLGPEEIRAYQLPFDEREAADAGDPGHRGLGSALPFSGHAAQDVVDRGRHACTEETADVPGRAQPGRSGAATRSREAPQASHHPDDLRRRRAPSLGSRAVDRVGD